MIPIIVFNNNDNNNNNHENDIMKTYIYFTLLQVGTFFDFGQFEVHHSCRGASKLHGATRYQLVD